MFSGCFTSKAEHEEERRLNSNGKQDKNVLNDEGATAADEAIR